MLAAAPSVIDPAAASALLAAAATPGSGSTSEAVTTAMDIFRTIRGVKVTATCSAAHPDPKCCGQEAGPAASEETHTSQYMFRHLSG